MDHHRTEAIDEPFSVRSFPIDPEKAGSVFTCLRLGTGSKIEEAWS